MWIARDKDDTLKIGDMKPMGGKCEYFYPSESYVSYLNENLFPEVTFENSPIEVEIKLKM